MLSSMLCRRALQQLSSSSSSSSSLLWTKNNPDVSRSVIAAASSYCRYFSKDTEHLLPPRVKPTDDPLGTRTKIVCTLGPSSDTKQQVNNLVKLGMHVARLNFSHAGSDYTYADANLKLVREASGRHEKIALLVHEEQSFESQQFNVVAPPPNLRAVLVDTKGPEIRTGPLPQASPELEIATGQIVELHINPVQDAPVPASEKDVFKLHVDYQSIAKTVTIGSKVLLDDGLIELDVIEIDTVKYQYVITRAMNGGPIKPNKGVNLPGATLDLPALTDKDKRDLRWACRVGADFVAASFIRTPENVRSVIAFLDRCIAEMLQEKGIDRKTGGNSATSAKLPLRPLVISKIESQEGVENFDAILKESDGIMVARGDLGVEIPYSKVFAEQKRMVDACNQVGKPVIVATQMLDSMTRNPRPTRAEVTDVGTAVLDGADAVMLSGETAAGKYPIEALVAMNSVVSEADKLVDASPPGQSTLVWNQKLHNSLSLMDQELDSVSASSCQSAKNMNAKLIILITMSGRVARAVARHRPTVPVLAFCTDPQVARRLQLHRSVVPVMLTSSLDPGDVATRMAVLRAEAVRTAKELGYAKAGDRIVLVDRTPGKAHDMHEYSHNMKVVTLK